MPKYVSALLCAFPAVLLLAWCVHAAPVSADPALEKHVARLTEELRCLVCQNQTIADSQAQLAVDLKNQVRQKLVQGASDQEVLDYMVQRYGDFVLYRPPLKGSTLFLWFGPFLLLVFGVIFFFIGLRQRNAAVPEHVTDSPEKIR